MSHIYTFKGYIYHMDLLIDRLENIDKKLENLDKINDIENRLQTIEGKLQFIKDSGIRMNNHISFVESIYNTVKYPFFYIMNKIQPINTKDIEMNYQKKLLENQY
jgi:hypothetical protein